MQPTSPFSPERVTPDDLDLAVRLTLTALRAAPPEAWEGQAGSLEWSCWETVEHLSDGFLGYAAQLGPKQPPQDGYVPFAWSQVRAGAPANAIRADRSAGPAGLLQVFEACGAILGAMVRTAPPTTLAFHSYGSSDPEGFTAMAVVEALAHTHDLAEGLGLPWDPPAGLCTRVLHRLFPDAPTGHAPWLTLRWATGRAELPGHPRRTEWQWHGAPLPR
ncbi:DinB family protein [Kitasatospora sp. NPDC002227]|uniref:DinB family protein n=1 Tax=Kitasatospora sp. NPDC002227 TaxID=3154773 RepID=UPI0033335F41